MDDVPQLANIESEVGGALAKRDGLLGHLLDILDLFDKCNSIACE